MFVQSVQCYSRHMSKTGAFDAKKALAKQKAPLGKTPIEPVTKALGAKLRAVREANGVGVREFARRLGCSPSHVSQVERNIVEPSVSLLIAMAANLGVPMESLFDDQLTSTDGPNSVRHNGRHERRFIQRAKSRLEIRIGSGVIAKLLLPEPDDGVDFCEYIYEPNSSSVEDRALIRHPGREFGVVLEGELKVQIGFEEFILGPGDAITLDSSLPHRFCNDTEFPTRAIWLSLRKL